MAKLGTAFVDIQPDFSAFDRLVARKLAGSFQGTGEQAGTDFTKGFSRKAKVKVDADRSAFSRVADAAQNLLSSLGGSGGGGGLTGATARVSAGFVSFGSVVGPLAAILGVLAVTIAVSLAGALAALVASLAAAAAGAAALGVAFAAVLGPAVALGVAVGARLAKVFEALKAQDAAADDVGRKTAAGSAAAAAATQALESAERSRSEAVRQLGLATSAAYREMADSAERASDAIRGIERAQISLESAKIGTERARLELEKFREEAGATDKAFGAIFTKFTDVAVDTSGLKKAIANANAAGGGTLDSSQELELRQKILDVRDARQREREATDGVSDAQREATRAQQDNNKFKREGIRASEQYRGALRSVQAATLAVAQAQRQNDSSIGTASEKATQLTGRLSKSERGFLGTLKAVRKELTGAFGPATDAVLGGMNRALARAPQLVNPLRGAFRRLGVAVGGSLDKLSADFVKPKTVASFRRFTDTAARLAGPITDGLLSLFHIFLNIANAALPHLVSGTKSVAGQLKKWDVGTSNSKKMSKSIGTLVGHLKTWLGVGAAIGDVFLAFLESAAGPGQSLAESIKDVAERTADWLRSTEGREQLKQFFKDTISFTKDFVEFMGRLIGFTVRFGQEGARVFSKVSDLLGGSKNLANGLVFALATLAAFKFTKGLIGGIKDVHSAITGAHKAATILHSKLFANTAADASTGLVAKAKTALSAIGSALASTGRAVVSAGRAVARRLIAVFAAQGALAGVAAGEAAAGTKGLASAGVVGKMRKVGTLLGKGFGLGLVAAALFEIANADFTKDLGRKINNLLPGKNESKARSDWFQKASDSGLSFADYAKKHPIPRATGGPIPGSGNRDTVPILATPGEFMTRKLIVQRFGQTVFADINAGRLDPRVGYQAGQQPSVGVQAVRGPRMATGGLVGDAAGASTGTTIVHNNHITVPGGGQPDPLNLSVQLARLSERRFGGDPGNR